MPHDTQFDKRRSCVGKQNHADPIHALVACSEIYRRYRENVFAYPCRHCANYHVGHVNRRVAEFIQMLIEPQEVIRLTYTLADKLDGALIRKMVPR